MVPCGGGSDESIAVPIDDSSQRASAEPLGAVVESLEPKPRVSAAAEGTAEAIRARLELELRVMLAMDGGIR